MADKKKNLQSILSLAVVSLLLMGVFAPSASLFIDDGAHIETAKTTEDNIKGEDDWTITGKRYVNISKSQDSNIIIDGGTLEINDATLTLLLDEWNAWEIKLRNGGELILKNSSITTQSRDPQLGPILKTNVSAHGSSSITLKDNSAFLFPGWVYLNDSNLTLKESKFDKFDGEVPDTLSTDDNDDCPMLTAANNSDVLIEDSQINNYYRNTETEDGNSIDEMEWLPRERGDDNTGENFSKLLDGNYIIEQDESMNITTWNHDPFYTPREYRYVNPFDRISALHLKMRYDIDDNYDANDNVSYWTPSGWKTATKISEYNETSELSYDIWELDLNHFKRSGDEFLKDLTVNLTNTDDSGSKNNITIDDISLVSSYNNDINIWDSDLTIINSQIDVDYDSSEPDPTDEEVGTTSRTWMEKSNMDSSKIRLLKSSLKGYGLSPSGTWEPSGDPVMVADEESNNRTWIYRWITVSPKDNTSTPLNRTNITVGLSDTIKQISEDLYNNTNNANHPTNNTKGWEYFNKSGYGTYNKDTNTYVTNEKGKVTIFLVSDRINHPGDWKNGKFVGEYNITADHPELGTVEEDISLESFPDLNESANHKNLDIIYDDEIDHPDMEVTNDDLAVKYQGTDVTYSTEGADLDINLTVHNIGKLNATNVNVTFYLDDLNNPINQTIIQNINNESEEEISINWEPTETGTHEIIAVVDPNDVILELDESNNQASTIIDIGDKPDLLVDTIHVDAPVIDHSHPDETWVMNYTTEAELSATVRNVGGDAGIMDEASDINVTFYYDNNDTAIGYRDGLDLSESGDSVTTIPVNWNYPGPGDYTIRAMVDSEMVVSEGGNGTNNNETQKIVVKEGPDVIPSTLSVDPTDPHEDTMVEFSCWVSNVGGWDSGNINVTFSVDGEPVGYGEASSLAPTDSPVEVTYMWLAEIEGKALNQERTVSVAVTEDSGYETITNNNTDSTGVTVRKPAELSVENIDLSSSTDHLQVNQSIDITAEILNSGGENVTNANVVFYEGEPEAGNEIKSVLVNVSADSNKSVTITWTANSTGNHVIYVSVGEDRSSVKVPIFSQDYQYDLIVDDENSPYIINGDDGIDGFIMVKESGRLLIEGERDQAEFEMMMDEADQYSIFVTDNGQMSLSNALLYSDTDFDIIVDEEGSFTTDDGSFLYPTARIRGTDDCLLDFTETDVESSIELDGGTFISKDSSFNSPSMDLAPRRIDSVNTTFEDDLDDFNNTKGTLTAVDVDSISMTENSRIEIYRWLEIHTVSNSSISIGGAQVLISSKRTDFEATGTTDSDGMLYLPALTDILTPGDETWVGSYKIDSTYSVESGDYTIDPSVEVKLPDHPSDENVISVELKFENLLIPDLYTSDDSITTSVNELTVGEEVDITTNVENLGKADATGVNVLFYLGDGEENLIGQETIDVISGGSQNAEITWTSTMADTDKQAETKEIRVVIDPDVNPIDDANVANNEGKTSITVKSLPELEFTSDIQLMVDEEERDPSNITESDTLNISFNVVNSGGTNLENATVHFQTTDFDIATKKVDIAVDDEVTLSTEWLVNISGADNIVAFINSSVYQDITISDSAGINVEPLELNFNNIQIPITEKEKGESVQIEGYLERRQDGKPIEGIRVDAVLLDDNGNPRGEVKSDRTDEEGYFSIFIVTPERAGDYTVRLTPDHSSAEAHQTTDSFAVASGEGGGIPLWLIAVILIAAAGASFGGILLYLRFRGLGEWVECGECGATIPADSTTCPKCGADFEMGTVKCSECGEWIPAESSTCPHCGAEFIMTGEEVEEYSDRMEEQYEKYVEKYRKEARKELGDEFSEDKFMDWWKGQPTYLTFDEWLEREEERRRKGGIECPECGALNSIDDAICHKCGSTLIDVGETKPSPGLPEDMEDEEEKKVEKQPKKSKETGTEEKEEPREEGMSEEKSGEKVEPKKVKKKVKKRPKRAKKKVKKKVVKKKPEEEEE